MASRMDFPRIKRLPPYVFNVVGDPVAQVVSGYHAMLKELAASGAQAANPVRAALGATFTRGHFARAV